MGPALVRKAASEHSGNFVDSFFFGQQAGFHPGCLVLGCFMHLELVIGTHGDLGQVSDAEGLSADRKAFQQSADGICRVAPYASIHLIENLGLRRISGFAGNLDGQADAR